MDISQQSINQRRGWSYTFIVRLPYLTVKRGLSKPGGLSLEVRFIHIRERYEVLKLKRGVS